MNYCSEIKGLIFKIDTSNSKYEIIVYTCILLFQQPNWFHYKCFWKRASCKNPDDIYNFHSLRWDDQEKIRKEIGSK